jgi:hypothetical protein
MQIKTIRRPKIKSFLQSPWQRQLLFLGAAILSTLIMGYHYGSFDQNIHIPFVKAWADPNLYPNDAFMALRYQHYSFFWLIFVPFYRWGLLEPALFAAHLLANQLTFWAVWELSTALFDDSLAALLAVVTFIFPHVGFLGFPILEFSLLNRTFVLPFLLFATSLFLRGKRVAAFALLGVLYNLHLLTVNFVLVMFLFTCMLERRRISWKTTLAGLGAFILCALPVLAWKGSGGATLDWSLRPEWLSAFTRSSIYSIFYLFGLWPPTFLLTLNGLCAVALYAIARRGEKASEHTLTEPLALRQRELHWMMISIFGVLAVQVITTSWLPVTWIIQMQISRISLFALIFSLIFFARWLVQAWQAAELPRGSWLLLAGLLVCGTLPALPLAGWAWLRRLRRPPSVPAALGITAASALLTAAVMGAVGLWSPGLHIYSDPSPWVEVQQWSRDHTPRDAVFITPPQEYGLYTPDWRVLSERASVVTLSEIFEVALNPQDFPRWKTRYEALAPGALQQFAGNFFENQAITERTFYALSSKALLEVACRYRATYLVEARPHTRPFPLIYENDGYQVYDLSKNSCQ